MMWHLISDESVWPSRLRSARFCKMAPIVRQSLATIPTLCGLVVLPWPAEVQTMPPSPVQSFLRQQIQTGSSPLPSSSGYSSSGSTPVSTLTGTRKSFGLLPQPSPLPLGPPATTLPMSRRTVGSGTSSTTGRASQHAGLFSTIPPLKLGTSPSPAPRGVGRGIPSAAAAGLSVAISGASSSSYPVSTASLGGRSSFLLKPYSSHPRGCSHTAGAPKDDDEAVDTDILNIACDVRHKCHHDGNDSNGDEGEEDDGSGIEDMTVGHGCKGKSQHSPTKSGKKDSTTVNYTDEDIQIVCDDRYAKDLDALQAYRNRRHGVKDFKFYGWNILPCTSSGRWADGENTPIE